MSTADLGVVYRRVKSVCWSYNYEGRWGLVSLWTAQIPVCTEKLREELDVGCSFACTPLAVFGNHPLANHVYHNKLWLQHNTTHH